MVQSGDGCSAGTESNGSSLTLTETELEQDSPRHTPARKRGVRGKHKAKGKFFSYSLTDFIYLAYYSEASLLCTLQIVPSLLITCVENQVLAFKFFCLTVKITISIIDINVKLQYCFG